MVAISKIPASYFKKFYKSKKEALSKIKLRSKKDETTDQFILRFKNEKKRIHNIKKNKILQINNLNKIMYTKSQFDEDNKRDNEFLNQMKQIGERLNKKQEPIIKFKNLYTQSQFDEDENKSNDLFNQMKQIGIRLKDEYQKFQIIINNITKFSDDQKISHIKININEINDKKLKTQIINKIAMIPQHSGTIILVEMNMHDLTNHISQTQPKYFYLNDECRQNLIDRLDGEIRVISAHGSDIAFMDVINAQIVKSIELTRLEKPDHSKKSGKFFPYLLEYKDFDLSRYQIFSKLDNKIIKHINTENCFIHSLRLANVNDYILEQIKLYVRNTYVSIVSVKKLANEFKLRIQVRTLTGRKTTIYGPKDKNIKIIKLGLIEDHYFLIEKTKYTKYSIDHYNKIKDLDNWNNIFRKKSENLYHHTNSRYLNSFKLIKRIVSDFKLGKESILKLIPMDYSALNIIYNKDIKITQQILDYDVEKCTRPIVYKEKICKTDLQCFVDFEAQTNGIHKSYMCACIIAYKGIELKREVFHGKTCGLDFLEFLNCFINIYIGRGKLETPNVLLYAHNMNYDLKMMAEFCHSHNFCYRSGDSICGGTMMFKSFNHANKYKKSSIINIVDTYALIPNKLSEFNEMWELGEYEKEVFPYELYNGDYIFESNPTYDINKASKFLNKKQRPQFIKNIETHNFYAEDKTLFKLKDYAAFYCMRDVEVMLKGYFKLKKELMIEYELNSDPYLTISSIADSYIKKRGCYEGCFEHSGIPRLFMQRSVIGGRTMSRDNQKFHLKSNVHGKINDLDASALYPSAMKFMPGFLKGHAKVISSDMIKQLNKDNNLLNQFTSYFLEIKIIKINKKLHFPLINEKNKDGVRIYSNEIPKNTIVVDKQTLEDFLTFQKIEYEIICGYYFDQDYNKSIKTVIQEIFDKRVLAKIQGNNAKQMLTKLIMNSIYGKTILKDQEVEYKFFNNEQDLKKFTSKNYNSIIEFNPMYVSNKNITPETKYILKRKKAICKHFNACHIGANILSMSKHIMNEVMCLAEDLNIKIYYQDTDSMHIEDNKIKFLSEEFKKKYDRDLIGTSMGQFQCDFQKIDKISPIAVETIILGKKAYLDKLEYHDKQNNKIFYKYHFRMKGVTDTVIEKHSIDNKEYNCDVLNIYKALFNGDKIKFNLTSCGIKFEKNKNFSIKTKYEFPRVVSF